MTSDMLVGLISLLIMFVGIPAWIHFLTSEYRNH